MSTKEINRIFYALGKLETNKDKIVIVDGNSKRHMLTLKESLAWSMLKKYPMSEKEFISSLIDYIRICRLGIYMDAQEALRVMDSLLDRGIVIMGVGTKDSEGIIDLLGQVRFKSNDNFGKVVKKRISRLSFISLISTLRIKRLPEAKKLIELYDKEYSMWDILEDKTLMEDVLTEEEQVIIPLITLNLLVSQIIVEDGCFIKKYNRIEDANMECES